MTANALPENRTTRVAYKDSYVGDIHISKTEAGLNSSIDRKPITYVMEQAFPYQIDAIPLQFGSSQITRVTAQFKYQRHYTKVADVSAAPQLKKGGAREYFDYETVTPLTDEQKLENLKRQVAVVGNRNLAQRIVAAFPPD